MTDSNADGPPQSSAVLDSMTLLATLSTAAEVCRSVAERRAGRDPAAQEPPERAAARVRNSGRELMDVLMQIALSRVPLDEREGQLSAAVRHFDLLMKVRGAEHLVREMHQRLLSLYPDVSANLVEEARIVRAELADYLATVGSDANVPLLSDVLERAVGLVVWTRHEVPLG